MSNPVKSITAEQNNGLPVDVVNRRLGVDFPCRESRAPMVFEVGTNQV